jgi:fused signal recognition particle receptor
VVAFWIVLAIILVAVVAVTAFVAPRRGRRIGGPTAPTRPGIDYTPGVGDDAEVPRDTPIRSVGTVVDLPPVLEEPAAPTLERPEPTATRMVRLRARLARSQTTLGRGLLSVLSRERLDDDAWEDVEDTLLTAHPHQSARHPLAG